MPTSVTFLRVFVSSPDDVRDDVNLVEEVVRELNISLQKSNVRLEVITWETHTVPDVGSDAQAVINLQIGDDYDIFLGIMGNRIGAPTPRHSSGTVEEYDRAFQRHLGDPTSVRIMFYFRDTPVSPSKLDPEQVQRIREFKERLQKDGVLWKTYEVDDDFKSSLRLSFSEFLGDYRSEGLVDASSVELSEPVRELQDAFVDGDETELEEEGFLDLIEVGVEKFNELSSVSNRITGLTNELTEAFNATTTKLNGIDTSDYRSSKEVVRETAIAMEKFADDMKPEIETFAQAYSQAITAYSRAATIAVADFKDLDRDLVANAHKTVDDLGVALAGARDSMIKNPDIVKTFPRLTGQFNRAKRKTLVILEEFLEQLEAAIVLTDDTKVTFQRLLDQFTGQ